MCFRWAELVMQVTRGWPFFQFHSLCVDFVFVSARTFGVSAFERRKRVSTQSPAPLPGSYFSALSSYLAGVALRNLRLLKI